MKFGRPILAQPLPSRVDRALLFVTHDLSLSGAPILLLHLARWCAQDRLRVAVLSPLDGAVRNEFRDLEFIVDEHAASNQRRFLSVARDFDCVVANTIRNAAVVDWSKASRLPVIWWLHETRLGERILRRNPETMRALACAELIVAPCEETMRVYQPHTTRALRKLVSGIPVPNVQPSQKRGIKFLNLGTIEHRKGQDVLLEAIAQVAPHLWSRAELQIVGSGVEVGFIEQIRRRASSLPNVSYGEAVPHEKALQLIANSGAFILSSRDEAMPLTLLEAMALGKTIIATRVGGIDEYLAHEETALLVSPDDAADLAKAIANVITDENMAARLAANARTAFLGRHTIDKLGRQFLELLAEIAPAVVSASQQTWRARLSS